MNHIRSDGVQVPAAAAQLEIAKQERAADGAPRPNPSRQAPSARAAKSVAPKAATSFAPKARATPHAAPPLHARAAAPTAAPPRAPDMAPPGRTSRKLRRAPRTTPPPPDASEAVAAHVAKVCSTLGGAVPEGTTWPARRDVYADREVALSPADQEIARPRFFDTAGLMGAAYRVGACVFACCVLAFFSVASPASRSNQEYNLAYKLTLQRVFASFAPPVVLFLLVFDARHATCIDAAKAFFSAFGAGFVACVGAELLASTFIWNQALEALEPEALRLVRGLDDCPLRFPTVLRDHRIPIQRRTQLLAELVVSCVAAPILEEAAKLWAARRARRSATPRRPRGARSTGGGAAPRRTRALRPQRRRLFALALAPAPPALEVEAPPPTPHVHTYLTHCLASAIGFKMADATPRICLYNRPWHPQKMFFAVVRGALPIHELCAALTASRLARRDAAVAERLRDPIAPRRSRPRVLGPLAVVLPAALLHASANFRGAKPVLRESNQPWVELQLQAWNQPDDAAPAQLRPSTAIDARERPPKGFEGFRYKPIFGKPETDIWALLIEKAFAKMIGSYPRLDAPHAERSPAFFGALESWSSSKYLIAASIRGRRREGRRRDGLVETHAYGVLACMQALVQLRNPWGDHEWKGSWSKGSKEWYEDDDGWKRYAAEHAETLHVAASVSPTVTLSIRGSLYDVDLDA
ncbi:STAS domain containing protein [Aureococcus anophagefferens]|nr:STAS domain containing protein [Aureococcus anophagefferens]